MDLGTQRPSTAGLLGDALSKTSQLIGSEIHLVKVELAEKITVAISAVVAIVVAAIFLIVAMIFLLQGLVFVLVGLGFSAAVANFIVGGGVALCAIVAIVVATRSLSASRLSPHRSLRQAQQSVDLVKGSSR